MEIWKPRYSCCLLWSWVMYYRHKQKYGFGGYVAFRRSLKGWWFHVIWSPDRANWWSYVPFESIEFSDRFQIPPPIFRGKVVYSAV